MKVLVERILMENELRLKALLSEQQFTRDLTRQAQINMLVTRCQLVIRRCKEFLAQKDAA